MDNFNLKKYLAEGRLLKEDISGYDYPEDIQAMDKEIADLKAKLDALIKAKNKAKSDFTKSMPSIKDEDEFKNMDLPSDKRAQYKFKSLVDFVKKVSEESGNDWEALNQALKEKFPNSSLDTYTRGENEVIYIPSFFNITKGEDQNIQAAPSKYLKIGDWYVSPW